MLGFRIVFPFFVHTHIKLILIIQLIYTLNVICEQDVKITWCVGTCRKLHRWKWFFLSYKTKSFYLKKCQGWESAMRLQVEKSRGKKKIFSSLLNISKTSEFGIKKLPQIKHILTNEHIAVMVITNHLLQYYIYWVPMHSFKKPCKIWALKRTDLKVLSSELKVKIRWLLHVCRGA